MREPGLAATVGYITREPTCSWCNRPLTLPPLPRLSWNTESVIGVLIPLVYQHAPVWHTRYCTQTLTLSLPLTHTSKHAHTHSLIRYEHTHKNTHPLSGKSPPRLTASAILDTRSVLYGRDAGTLLVASFPFKPDPSTSVFECYVVVLQALPHCLDCFSACRICLPLLPVSSLLLQFLQNQHGRRLFPSRRPLRWTVPL